MSGAGALTPIAAGQSYDGLEVTLDENKFGANSETITFNPTDTNDSGYTAPLAPVTLNISYTLESPAMAYSQAWGDVHIITYNNLTYNFQAVGEFVLAHSTLPGDTFDIQIRLAPFGTSTSVSVITEIAIKIGADTVTFGLNRPTTVWLNGVPSTVSLTDPLLSLAGGTVDELSANTYKIIWNTGETATFTNNGTYFSIVDGIPTSETGYVSGLQGENEGQQNDFQLADGTVLQQPLPASTLYGEYANSWRVSQATSLFDYGPGQTTQTFTNLNFPYAPLTLASLPASAVAAAAAAVAAAGITDPAIALAAELDYLATGDSSFIASAAVAQQQAGTTTAAMVTQDTTPPTAIAVTANAASVVEAANGPTDVTFTVSLTETETEAEVVNYAVVAPDATYLGAGALGGVLPSGQVTIAAGQTSATVTIAVPQDALGDLPTADLELQVSATDSTPVAIPLAQTMIVNAQAEPGSPASAELLNLGQSGTFTQISNNYTLDLGTLVQGQVSPLINFALTNTATAPADFLSGQFSPPDGSGFIVTGNNLPAPLAAGGMYSGVYADANTSTLGAHSETMTFTPRDENPSGYQTTLPALTLTIEDTIGAAAQATVNTPSTIVFQNVRVGMPESEPVSISNSAAPPAAGLDIAPTTGGDATVAGAITDLAAGATDTTSLTVGLGTTAAGAQSGYVTLNASSDTGSGNSQPLSESPTIDIFGSVFRLATGSIAPVDDFVHVGDPGTVALTVANSDAADGYSENLLAALSSVSGEIGLVASGPTGEIAAGSSSNALKVSFSTAQTGTLTGTAEVVLTSDGGTGAGSIDGLGQAALGMVAVPVTVTVDNYAVAELTSSGGQLTAGTAANSYVLNLGTLAEGATPTAVSLAALNAALGPADDLDGSYTISSSSGFTNTGFAAFSDLGAGSSAGGNTVSLNTSTAGNFSETITLDPTDSNSSGYSEALPDETVTVVGSVLAPSTASATGSATGDVHIVSFDGLHYGFQALGDFTLTQSTLAGDSFRIQIQTAVYPYIAGTSVITEAAAQVGSDIVTFGIGQAGVTIYGVPDASLSATHPTQLLDGGEITLIAPDTYQLSWATGESMTVKNMGPNLNISVGLGSQDGPGSVQGLLGRYTGIANDISLPDGTVLRQPVSAAELLGAFANAWTVAPSQSLLNGAAGLQSTTIPGTVLWPATAGSAGRSVAATEDVAALATNSAAAQGDNGGVGGNGASSPTDPATGDYIESGGTAAAGGKGGGAAATATTNITEPSLPALASATATGGNGGAAGTPGLGTTGGRGAAGGTGGTATAAASATNTSGVATASASAVGGAGGAAFGVGGSAGGGGLASGTTAEAQGTTSASASVTQIGGNGGDGSEGANGGSGGLSSLTNAVSGTTDDGTLTLFQDAVGGNGGNSDTSFGAAGGSAISSLTFDDTGSATQSAAIDATVQAQGGNAGAGALYRPEAGNASVYADITGVRDVTVAGTATGGTSPDGAGGSASAAATATAGGTASASATSTGGAGVASASSDGSGGASTGATATASGTTAMAMASGTGGQGGDAAGAGNAAGSGGLARGTSAVATGTKSAAAAATQTGGAGGAGSGGASGAAGASSTLQNAVRGSTADGALTLTQIADGGAGGASDSGAGGSGGFAISDLTLNDATNPHPSASIIANVSGVGGAGGASTTGIGGNGGSTWDAASVTGAGLVTLTTTADGGNAGTGGAQGGDAEAAATAVGAKVDVTANAIGGSGQTGSGIATANAQGTGASGSAQAIATTALAAAGPVGSVSGDAVASVDGAASAAAQASFGGAVSAYVAGLGAVADIKALPTAASVTALLAADPTTTAALGGTPAFYSAGEVGGGHSPNGSASQTSTASTDITLDLLQLASRPDLFLAFLRPSVAGSGITGIALNVTADGTSLISESFASAAAAKTWFSDHPIDLGSLASGVLAAAPTLDLHVALSVTSSHAGSGFDTQFLVAGAPANSHYALI